MEDFTGTTSADKLSGKGGNDALSGGEGNDQIEGGDGDDLIGGGLGSHSIKGCAGNDTIYSAIDLNVALRTKADEQWDLPVGATLKSKGNNWGIAITADGQSTVNAYLQAGAADNAPDFIDAGDGDDTVVAGRGNDMVQGGLGGDILWGGGGNDVVDGGDGRDIIHGEGLLRFSNTPGYVAPEDYGDDFLDGGARDDQSVSHRTRKAVCESDYYQINSDSRIFYEGYRPILHARLGAKRAICLHGSRVIPNNLRGPRRHAHATF